MKKLLLALSFLVIGCTTWAQNVNSFIDICTYGYEDGWSDGYFEKTVLHIINPSLIPDNYFQQFSGVFVGITVCLSAKAS